MNHRSNNPHWATTYMVNTYSLYSCWGSVFMYNTCIHAEFTVFSLYLYSLYSYWAAYSCIIHVFKVPYPCIHHVGIRRVPVHRTGRRWGMMPSSAACENSFPGIAVENDLRGAPTDDLTRPWCEPRSVCTLRGDLAVAREKNTRIATLEHF